VFRQGAARRNGTARTSPDLIIETLEAAGVPRIHGVAGDSLHGTTESLRRSKAVQWVHMRHEEAGAFARTNLRV
jgi:pyruvate dehydrogenase (quinone)